MARIDGLLPMATTYIPADHSLLRYVPFARLRRDEHDTVVGVLGAAFRLREGEDYLSATWMEFFAGSRQDQITKAVQAIRASDLKPTFKSGFAIGLVEEICSACESHRRRYSLRIIHEPQNDNEAHAAVRGWPRYEDELLELIADDVWNKVVLNRNIP